MRISDWSSDVCSSDLEIGDVAHHEHFARSAVEDHGGVDAAVGTGDHHHLGRLALVGENVETGALGGIGALAEPAVAGDKIIDAIHATSGIAGKEGWQEAIETPISHSSGHQPQPARTTSPPTSLPSPQAPQRHTLRPTPLPHAT